MYEVSQVIFFVNEVEYHDLSKKDLYANLKLMTKQYFYLTQLNVSKEKRIDVLYNNLYKTYSRHDYYYKRLANKIKEISLNSYPSVDKNHSDVKNLLDMASILQENIKTINEMI